MPPQPRHARQRARPAAAAANQAAAQQARQPKPKPPPQTFQQQRTAARGAARTRARATLAKRTAGVTPEGAAVVAADVGSRAARDARQVRFPTGDRQYQGVILAEFLVAVFIVSAAPLARGKQSTDTSAAPWGGGDSGSGAYGPSPYGVDDFKQLLGVGAVYFILALLSSGKHGRFAAWFGGLILVAIGLAQTTSGGLPAIFGIFQPGSQSAAAGTNQFGAGLGQYAPIPDPAATFQQVPDATGIFPVIGPTSTTITPSPTGQPSFTQQVTQADGTVATIYSGGPGVITTGSGTQLA